nr:hypothetical protein [Candidatus Phaeomarinobacter ectocarpi]
MGAEITRKARDIINDDHEAFAALSFAHESQHLLHCRTLGSTASDVILENIGHFIALELSIVTAGQLLRFKSMAIAKLRLCRNTRIDDGTL